jgi:fructan beta-fructosidase
MKKIIVFIALSVGCAGTGCRTRSDAKPQPLHFMAAGSGPVEPIALIDYRGVYRIFYSGSRNGGAGAGPGTVVQATTRDLVHWTASPAFLLPQFRDAVFHGGIVIDSSNLSGFGTKEKPPLVALVSSPPGLAFSLDEGKTWTAAAQKPGLPESFTGNPQDISILWHPATKKWVMSVAVADHMEFYSSPDLRSWAFESSVGGDFFPEEVNWRRAALYPCGDGLHWFLLADIKKEGDSPAPGGTVYFIGSFDGHRFVNQSAQLHWLDYGEDIYGGIVAIGADGRPINLGWKKDSVNQPMMIPRKLDFEKINGEPIITTAIAPDLKALYGREIDPGPVGVSYKTRGIDLVSGISTPVEVFLKFNTSGIQKGSFPLRFGVRFGNDRGEHIAFVFDRFGYYYLDRSGLRAPAGPAADRSPVKMPFDHADSTMSFHFIVDEGIIECFAEGGKLVMSGTYPLDKNFDRLELFSVNGDMELEEGRVMEFR